MATTSSVLSSVLSFTLLMSGTSAVAWAAAQEEPSETSHKPAGIPRHDTQKSRHVSPNHAKSRHQDEADESLTVRGHAHPVNGGALGTKRVLDTPFSIRTVTAAEIQERQVKSLARVFSQDASVISNGDTYSFNAYSVTVRGVPLDDYNGYKINGTPFFMTTVELPLESFEAVQLLKGASGFMYGFNAPGGIIDFQTKKPTDARTFSFDAGYSSGAVGSQHIDTGGRLFRNDIVGYRLNLTHENGETYSGSHVTRFSGSLSTDVRLAPNLLWTADAIYQDRKVQGGVQDFFIDDPSAYGSNRLPDAISGHKNLTASPASMFTSHTLFVSTGLHWDITKNWTARIDYSHSMDYRRYRGEWMSLQDQAGNYNTYMSTNPGSWAQYDQVQAILEGKFRTGFIRHDFTMGAAWQGLSRYLPYDSDYVDIGGQNLYAPVINRSYSGSWNTATYRNYRSDQVGLFGSDTLTFDKHWSLLAGIRFTDFHQLTWKASAAKTALRTTPLTPTAALMFHPWKDTTIYASYVQALENGGTVGDTYKNARETLPPIRSDQVEIGAKVARASWDLTGALYRITRGAQYANADNVYVSNGTVTYQGAELSGHVDLPFGITLTDSLGAEGGKYSKADATIKGNKIEGIPLFQNVFQLTDRIPGVPGLSATAEVHYTASMWGDSSNTYHVPSYTLLNLRASYRTSIGHHKVTLRAELDNATNLHYWGFLASDYFFVGTPRAVFLNARFDL
ncbi:hypothetical protein BAR24_01920 [Gluconobacter oxydans]|uniref:TonB-dependent siderophore receptor n=1 Tax=Gluconobacter thailandicus TaxID=257438 RepID=UPI0002995FB1|nr:TonB-dependent siderophore receptor [Gluconobacter thailandicus]AFW01025.1 outer membrane receptor, TonB dependent [Gluconobacter oxydans H24]ANQ40326.1 hypothetical protein BAR24_01920 [Gluconobacter oxydans]